VKFVGSNLTPAETFFLVLIVTCVKLLNSHV